MKVTIVLGTSTGGVGVHVRSLVERLPELGFDVAVACPDATATRFGFAATGVAVHRVEISTGLRPVSDWVASRRLRAIVRDGDLVHAHGLRAAALAGLAVGRRRPDRVPVIATWHNAVLGGSVRRYALAGLERLAATRADITLGASSDLVERARGLGALDARLAPVAAPAMRRSTRDTASVRGELGVADSQLVLAVGRLAPQKDYDMLLTASATWRDLPIKVVVAGDGPLRADLQRRIDAERLPVTLLGHRDDVADLLAAADIYVLTSRWEARPLVVQEAMTAGVPVVATAVGGVPELVGDGAALIAAGAADGLAHEVSALTADADSRHELGERGRVRSAQWPTEDDTARDVAATYRRLAGE